MPLVYVQRAGKDLSTLLGRMHRHESDLVQAAGVRADPCVQRARQQLSAEAQPQVRAVVRYPALNPVQLGADVIMALGVVDTLDAAINHHRGVVAAMIGERIAPGRVTPLEREATPGQVARHPVVAPFGHVSYQQNLLGHRNPLPCSARGGECITG